MADNRARNGKLHLLCSSYQANQLGLKADYWSLIDENSNLECILKNPMMSHYLKFNLLKFDIVTNKGSSVHQHLHAYNMAEEIDLMYFFVSAIKEK